ncbi:hypothetical protein CCS41_02755 [Candidatus Fukatsuia symbiotica]|uniref:Uncharacterized protein n=1 Tax=Candidatus Fukatsuia symbiotica TaxID=1878942 RepID=A0A2U8I3F4_9GAMM|nr:hypothetical protein CCS41_02755 [Candidatus Fukatsuia symbiotica]
MLPNNNIPFAFQVTAALAARTYPSHVLLVHSWDSIDCRLAVTRNSLGIDFLQNRGSLTTLQVMQGVYS